RIAPFCFLASSIISLTSLTPALIALRLKKGRSKLFAIMFESVVFPDPGGPQNIMEGILPELMICLRTPPSPARCFCPARDPMSEGRILSDNGVLEMLIGCLFQM